MQQIDNSQLANVFGGESLGQVARAARSAPDVPLDQTYGQTQQFIAEHPFFHEGLMNLPIGGGKHFRNVPFVGPTRIARGLATGSSDEIAKGVAVTRATWAAR
jgi:hypothetical protein